MLPHLLNRHRLAATSISTLLLLILKWLFLLTILLDCVFVAAVLHFTFLYPTKSSGREEGHFTERCLDRLKQKD